MRRFLGVALTILALVIGYLAEVIGQRRAVDICFRDLEARNYRRDAFGYECQTWDEGWIRIVSLAPGYLVAMAVGLMGVSLLLLPYMTRLLRDRRGRQESRSSP